MKAYVEALLMCTHNIYCQGAKTKKYLFGFSLYLELGEEEKQFYRIYPKHSDTLTHYHTCSKIWTSTIYNLMLCLKIAGWVANSADPDETPYSEMSHLGLHCLLKPVSPNSYCKYGNAFIFESGPLSSLNLDRDIVHVRVSVKIKNSMANRIVPDTVSSGPQ